MSEQCNAIGETAGRIYRALEQSGQKTLSTLQKEAGENDEALFNQAIGWLAREGKLEFQKRGRNWQISLAGSWTSV